MCNIHAAIGLHALLLGGLSGFQYAGALINRQKSYDDPLNMRGFHPTALNHRPTMMPAIEGQVDLYPEDSRTRQVNLKLPPEGHFDMFMNYMPDHNLVFCGCAKCGTTSFYRYLYQLQFGKPWEYGDTAPYVQDLFSERWQGKVVNISDETKQQELMESAYSFALVRDPQERLISSWKSKIACNQAYGVDTRDRSYLVHDANHTAWPRGFVFGVQRLYGAEENFTCLDLPIFVNGLVEIKKMSRTKYLDQHFLPQHEGCFYKYPPSSWSRLATISQQDAFDELAKKMGSEPIEMPSSHKSKRGISVAPDVIAKIDSVTQEDYDMLKSYLPTSSASSISAACDQCYAPKGQRSCVSMSDESVECSMCGPAPSLFHCPNDNCLGRICKNLK